MRKMTVTTKQFASLHDLSMEEMLEKVGIWDPNCVNFMESIHKKFASPEDARKECMIYNALRERQKKYYSRFGNAEENSRAEAYWRARYCAANANFARRYKPWQGGDDKDWISRFVEARKIYLKRDNSTFANSKNVAELAHVIANTDFAFKN